MTMRRPFVATWLLAFCLISSVNATESDPAKPLVAHVIAACGEYRAEESLKEFSKHLADKFKITCTTSYGKDGCEHLENIAELPEAELLILFARRMKLVDEEMKLIRAHWESGKPIVAIRTACHAFQQADNEFFDRKVLGGNYLGHYGDGECKVTNREGRGEIALLAGVMSFTSHKLYKMGALAEDTIVLQQATNATNTEPVTMIHTYKEGRIFFTSLGVPEDFQNEHFCRMLENAVFWTTHRERAKMAR